MAAKKEKKESAPKKKKSFSRYKIYKVSGDKLERKNKSCPKCGNDSYLAAHKDRLTCGKCGYLEMVSKSKPE
jgi:ubiquitin-small subunit ribosomal protein S27Ae